MVLAMKEKIRGREMRYNYYSKALCVCLAYFCMYHSLEAAVKKPFIDMPMLAMQQSNLPELSVTSLQSDYIFLPASSDFQPKVSPYLSKMLIMVQQADPRLRIYINAYSDDIPDAIDRKRMTEAQSEAIAHYLWSHGVAYSRMVVQGMGSKRMIGDPHYAASNALNRRVEVVLVPTLGSQQLYPFKD